MNQGIQSIGLLIKRKRKEKGLSQSDLNKLLGYKISSKFISQIERGVVCLPLRKTSLLCRILSIEINFLIDEYVRTKSSELSDRVKRIAHAFINHEAVQTESFGFYVRRLRGNRTKKEIARKAVITAEYLRLIESLNKIPSIEILIRLAAALGINEKIFIFRALREEAPVSAKKYFEIP